MYIEFRLESDNKDEQKIIPKFCEYLVRSLKQDIWNNITPARLQSLEPDILNASWIEWTKKPKSINVVSLVRLIISKIKYNVRKDNHYIILISRSAMMPYTLNRLEQIARFLDKGNEVSPCTTFLSSQFNKYQSNIDNYWDKFITLELKRPRTSKVVIIR